ncbi:MAG: (d)CMP kinase [Clostridiales bacterium]|nr:(d)CMP kinase [Clostridiales bacterium]MCD8108496.1 (d)CMP kinase [Clostridiales bacterium]MCD8134040.1 (d)CMP kinase [Clostridiales bacterium]
MSFNIAIDGPAGAGKSTIAKALAGKLSFLYVDTGAMYRAMACFFLTHGIPADDESALRAACADIYISLAYADGAQRVLLNGTDISDQIRREEVGNMASATSGYPFVREKLLRLQQDLAKENDVIMDGRDIGTCVLPDAQLKIYLTASVRTRAKRRYQELEAKGQDCDLEEIEKDIEARDYRDMHREIAPLKAAADAITVDSSEMSIEEVVREIYGLARKAGLEIRICG